jgi:hypothetical protein
MEWLTMTLGSLLGGITRAAPGPEASRTRRQAFAVVAIDRVRVIVALRLPPEQRRAVDRALVAVRQHMVSEIEAGRNPAPADLQAALTASFASSFDSR